MTDVDAFERRIRALATGARAPVAWFLDIDGVINIIGNRPRGGWPRYANTACHGIEGLAWPICWAPALVDLMNLMHQLKIISFRWLTTWEHEAPRSFAPAVGLDLGAWIAAEDTGVGFRWWKLDAIVEHLDETLENPELFIWTDDDIKHYLPARQVVDMLPAGRAMVVCTDQRKGITPEEFDMILTAIEEAVRI